MEKLKQKQKKRMSIDVPFDIYKKLRADSKSKLRDPKKQAEFIIINNYEG